MPAAPLPPEKLAEIEGLEQAIREAIDAEIGELAADLATTDDAHPFGDNEFQIRALAHRIAAKALEQHLARNKNGYEGATVTCPHCGQAAEFHSHRRRTASSLVGPIRYRRAYYLCRACGKGLFPFDQDAGLTARDLTPALERVATLAGAVADSFEKGAELLDEMAGVRLSESTVERTTEDAGQRLADRVEAGVPLGPRVDWPWHKDYDGRRCAYVELDATGVRQQGEGGGSAEGRMAYVGMVCNPSPEWPWPDEKPTPMSARYLAGLYPLEELAPLLRVPAGRVGMDHADRWIGLSDGGDGLEDRLRENFSRVEVIILDFFHPAEKLTALSRLLHPQDEHAAEEQARWWRQLLKDEGGAVLGAVLREWDWPRRPGLPEAVDELTGYLDRHAHRMEYPEYLAHGWCIGSAAVESACKMVVGQRLKLAGMRWGEDGAHAVCHLRALYRSEKGQWDAFWNRDFSSN
ncbi:MAG: ISKra4 family transposase [Singulisphaera sp.]|nr:ISKra4 family transposase [Singulisphaera sp.]